jgi:hypothetical protein
MLKPILLTNSKNYSVLEQEKKEFMEILKFKIEKENLKESTIQSNNETFHSEDRQINKNGIF